MSTLNANPSSYESRVLQALVLEDSLMDFELLVQTLDRAGLTVRPTRVSSKEGFQNLIATCRYDFILADYKLPGWTGMEALELVKQQGEDTPFLLVTSALGDELAAQCIREGAADLVLKMHLTALPEAVRRALAKRDARAAQKSAATVLRDSESMFQALADSIASAVLVYQGTKCRYSNRAAQRLTGYSEGELLDLDSWDLFHPDSHSQLIERGLSRLREARDSDRFETRILTKQGQVRAWDLTMGKVEIQGQAAGLVTALDVTEQRMAEATSGSATLRDPLTGLLSMAQAENAFLGEARRSRRTGRSFALVLLRLDALNQIQQQSGIVGSSRALCGLARVVGEISRVGDISARVTEDEFAVILPETAIAGARRFVQRVAERLPQESSSQPIAVSSGVAVFPQAGPTIEHAVRSARRLRKSVAANRTVGGLARSA